MDKKALEKLDKIINLLEEIKAKPEYHYYPPVYIPPYPQPYVPTYPDPYQPNWTCEDTPGNIYRC